MTMRYCFLTRLEKSFGVHQAELGWVRSYFTGQKQIILSSGALNKVTESISIDVTKASVLGPILFSLYVTDIEPLVGWPGLPAFNMLMISKCTAIPNHDLFNKLLVASLRAPLGRLQSVSVSTLVRQMQYGSAPVPKEI